MLLSLTFNCSLYAGTSLLTVKNGIDPVYSTSTLLAGKSPRLKARPLTKIIFGFVLTGNTRRNNKTSPLIAAGSPPTISYTTPNYYTLNTPIPALTPTSSGVAAINYPATPASLTSSALNGPWGMGSDASGNIYVCNYVTSAGTFDGVSKYTAAGAYSGTFISSVQNITGIVFDGSGNAYTCTYKGKIFKFNSTGGAQATLVTGPTNAAFTGIAIDAAGNLYVADFINKAVYKYSSTGTLLLTIPASANLTDPTGVQVDAAGNIYIGDGGSGSSATPVVNSSIVKYNSGGNYMYTLVAPGSNQGTYAYGFYMDKSGNIYVGDSGNNQVRMYTQSGTLLYTFNYSGITSPRGVFADASGNVYFTNNSTNKLYEFSPSGGYFISSGGALPAGLTLNSSAGAITGTPTVNASGTYTVTAYNSSGSVVSNSFVINCNSSAVTIAYNPSTVYLGTGSAITPITPTVTNSPASYAISPALVNGLSFSTSTGAISGTATGTATAIYTVTAIGAYNSASTTITITVGTPPLISYTTPNNYPIANAIPTLAPVSSGVNTSSMSYSTGTSLTVPSYPSNPWGIGSDPSGNIYVANYGGNSITKYTSSGAYSGVFIASVTGPTSIVFDASGNAYVGTKTGSIFKYNTSGTLLGTVATTPASVYGLGIDVAGNIYAADYVTKAVYKYSNSVPGTLLLTIASSANLIDPAGVEADGTGNIYIDDVGGTQIVKYSSAGAYISTLVTGLGTPAYGFYMDKSNNIYVGDSGNNQVLVYTQTGTLEYTFTGGLTSPRGIFADSFGNVYIAVYTPNLLYRYSPLGNYFLSGGGQLPAGLMFNSTNGNITGNSTVVQSGTYTVTGYTSTGIPGTSNSFVINCYIAYDWIGANSVFGTATNWKSLVVPSATSPAYIGVNYPFTVTPVIAANTTIASLGLGNKGGSAAGISINSGTALTVTGDITKQSDPAASAIYTSILQGAGTVTAANINILSNTAGTAAYTDGISSTVNSLLLSGNINLISGFSTYAENASFAVNGGVTTLAGLIKTTNASGADVSALSVSNATIQLNNAAALSSLSANGSNAINFANTGAVIEYSGASQTFYTDAAITGLATGPGYNSIKFSGTGAKTPNSGNLNVAGSFTNILTNDANNYITLTGVPVFFNGTTATAQVLAGGAGTGTTFKNVTFSGAAPKNMTSGMFNVISSGVLTISNGAQLTAGDANATVSALSTTDSFLTLVSDVNGSASVAVIPSGCAILGNVNVQRFITGGTGYRGYRLVSSPVSLYGNTAYTTLNYLIKSSFIKGSTGTAGGFDAAGNPNLYLYRDGLAPSNVNFTSGNFRGVNTINNSYSYGFDGETGSYNLYPGDGFLFFFRGDRNASGQTIATESVTSYVPTNTTATATGVLNQQSITPNYWYTGAAALDYTTVAGNSTVVGFNLVGNPYASTIDISTTGTTSANGIQVTALGTATGVSPYFYELNPRTQNYDTYNVQTGVYTNYATKYIVNGQGFFVLANAAGNTLTFNESAKTTAQNTGPYLYFAKTEDAVNDNLTLNQPEDQHLRLTLAKDSINTDDIYIGFNSKASAAYVTNEDAPYHFGQGQVNLNSTSSDNFALAVNITSLPKNTQLIPLGVYAATDGLYTLSRKELVNIPISYDIWLKDAYLKDSLDMRHNATYSFNIAHADTNSFGKNRFGLVFRQDPALALHLINFTATKSAGSIQTAWIVENEADYTKFTLLKSTDGITFSAIDSLISSGVGTYSFTDANPKNQNYYKLKLTDVAGNITFSSVVPVMYSSTTKPAGGFTVYPNPTNNTISIAVNQATIATSGLQGASLTANAASSTGQTYDIRITNMTGEVLKTVTAVAGNWQNNVSSLLPGTYIIQVMNHGSNSIIGRTTFIKL